MWSEIDEGLVGRRLRSNDLSPNTRVVSGERLGCNKVSLEVGEQDLWHGVSLRLNALPEKVDSFDSEDRYRRWVVESSNGALQVMLIARYGYREDVVVHPSAGNRVVQSRAIRVCRDCGVLDTVLRGVVVLELDVEAVTRCKLSVVPAIDFQEVQFINGKAGLGSNSHVKHGELVLGLHYDSHSAYRL